MEKNLLIAGGDLRQIYCAYQLCEHFNVYYTGFDNTNFSGNTAVFPVSEMNGKADFVILPVLPPDGKGKLTAPLYSHSLYVSDISPYIAENALIFTGTDKAKTAEIFPENEIIAYMQSEELALRNAIPTAEGAVMLALENLPVTLNGLPILIVGLGRIGTALANILKGFGADVTVAVRNGKGVAKAEICGIKSVCTDKITGDFPLIFNTVPNLIFTADLLAKFPDNSLFIELASKPYGIDMTSAEKLGKKVILAQGLPGKTAPVTAGKALATVIVRTIDERGQINE